MRTTSTRSIAKETRESSGFCALYVVAPIDPLPPRFPRNEPISPVRFGVSADPHTIGNLAQQWNWEHVALVSVYWTASRRHAEMLREKIEALLCEDDCIIRGSWYDLDMGQLVAVIRYAADLTGVEYFFEPERQERLQQAITEVMRERGRKMGAFA